MRPYLLSPQAGCRTPDKTGARNRPCSYFQLLILFFLSNLQSCLCQYVKERFPAIQRLHNAGRKGPGRVENNGFEPLTPCLQSRCSSQLS